jgi:hypothetical protein
MNFGPKNWRERIVFAWEGAWCDVIYWWQKWRKRHMAEIDGKLFDLVYDAMDNARDNGYDMDSMTDGQVAYDMVQYDADIQTFPFEDVEAAVHAVREMEKAEVE